MKKTNGGFLKKYFSREISLAKRNNFSAILLPYDLEYEAYFIDGEVDMEEVYEMGHDLGWDRFYYIDFISDIQEDINFYLLEEVA